MAALHWIVTGGLGFIGSAFVRLVLRERSDVRITVLDAMTYAANPANVADVAGDARYAFVHGDIADPVAVDRAVGDGVDAIINFAAETHVDRSILEPGAFVRTDVLGLHVLLETVRTRGIARFLQVSTDEVYGHVAQGASRETDALRPRNPYSASKAGAELLALSYVTTYAAPVLITRGCNTYGPYQHLEKLIPLFVTKLLDGETVPLYGDGLQIRDWLYVDDHARAILKVLEHGEPGEAYNIGADGPRTNLETTNALLALTGRTFEGSVRHVTDRPGHDGRYSLSTEKIRRLGWAPQVPFEEGISETVGWYRRNEAWWRPIKSGEFRRYYERQYAGR